MAPATATPAAATGSRTGNPAMVGSLAAVAAGAMAMTGIAVAYLTAHNSDHGELVAKGMQFNNYVAVTTVVSVILASLAVGWANTANQIGHRRWASIGFALAALLDFAALNLVWFLGKNAGLETAGGDYGVLFYGTLVAAGVFVAIAAVSVLSGAARVLGGQTTASQPHLGRAAAWPQHLGTAAWLAAWGLIYLLK